MLPRGAKLCGWCGMNQYQIYLGNEGYRYLTCENAAQALDILELQPDGKKAMASPAFLLGHPVSLGTILTKQE